MKRNSCLLLALLLSLACNPVEQSVKLEMPQKESLAIGSYETIYLLDFLLNLSDKSYDPRTRSASISATNSPRPAAARSSR